MYKKTKLILLTLLIFLPSLVILNSLFVSVNAGPNIPLDDPKNKWHWGVEEDDKIMFESEVVFTNMTNQQIISKYRNIIIYNISSITNVSGTLDGHWGAQELSQVMTELLWENPVGQLESSGMGGPLAYFGYNESHSITEMYHSGSSVVPIIFPINNTVLNISLMADIVNNSFLNRLYQLGMINKFNYYSYNYARDEIYFLNTTEGYYFNASYYENNGTVRKIDAHYLQQMGNNDWISVDYKGKRVFEYDITDEVEWGFDVGDTFYYHLNDSSSGYKFWKYDIGGFTKSIYQSKNWSFPPIIEWKMAFENVLGNLSQWNGTNWIPLTINGPIGSANNFYPICFPLVEMGFGGMFFFPTSADLEDFKFTFNNDTYRLLGYPMYFAFDKVYYSTTDNNIIDMTLNSSTNGLTVNVILNRTLGCLESQKAYNGSLLEQYFQRLPKLVEWPVQVGDIIYWKENAGDQLVEKRATITTINGSLWNMTYLENEMYKYGFLLSMPEDQPELQFFSELCAYFEVWDVKNEEWDYYSHPTGILAAANFNWAIAPYSLMGQLPVIFPIGTESYDFQYLWEWMVGYFDEFIYDINHITIRNSTLDYELHFIFNGDEGKTIYMYGWNYAGYWVYWSMYPENHEDLDLGPNLFILENELVPEITLTFAANTIGTETDFIYAVLSENPMEYPVPNGIPLGFFDMKITNYTLIEGNVAITINVPSFYDIRQHKFYFFEFNMSGTSLWDLALYNMIYNYGTNAITIEIPITNPYAYISTVAIDIKLPSAPVLTTNAEDPDTDGEFNLEWTESDGAFNYSLYEYHSYITEINASLTNLVYQDTVLTYSITDNTNRTYYFIVVAHNDFGDTLSNCLKVVVAIPPEEPPPDGDGELPIPGYDIYFILTLFTALTAILIIKKRKNL